ncbi:MAG: hypothetical protein M1830_005539 [Pleopsidium flavum]|nr:MAG: hypothetical protein M1830_005539 [Pleopsidium flavum]
MSDYQLPSYSHALTGGFVLILLYYVYHELTVGASRRKIIRENGCKLPVKYPHVDPILGIDLFRINVKAIRSHTFLREARARFGTYGNTFQSVFMGSRAIVTIEPENIKTILSLKFKDFGLGERRITAFIPLLGHGIFTTDGGAWQHSREMLRPNFTRSQVGDLETFERHVSQLIQAIPRDGSTIDLAQLFFRLTLDSATEFLFGESTNSLAPGTNTASAARFADAFNYSQHAISNHFRLGFLSAVVPDRQFNKDANFVHEFVDSYVKKALEYRRTHDVEKAEAKADERYVFLHELAKQTDDPLQIRSELLNILLAGRDTTASLLSNVWFTVAKRPDVWAKLRAEVDELGGQRPTFAQLKDMKYLRYTLNESLRLNPVVPGNSRTSVVDTFLPLGGGPDGKSPLFIPKGTLIAYSVYTMHRRKDFYGEDADDFKPERWEKLRPGWEYLPFNGGPRICLGQQFALTEASYTMIRMLQEFKSVESWDPGPWEESLTLTCTSKNGAKVALTPA